MLRVSILTGDWKYALKDAEKAVMLDSKNPDVYCIRALVRSTRNELSFALQDVRLALKYNPNHLCALIIKGCLEAPLEQDEWLDLGKYSENTDHKKACSINPDCHNYLSVQDFSHGDILAFYERFLYSLSIPHTVSEVVFVPRKQNSLHNGSRELSAKSTDSKISLLSNQTVPRQQYAATVSQQTLDQPAAGKPFRCGTPAGSSKEQEEKTAQRRRQYAEAIREHVTRPKTAEAVIAYEEKQRLKRNIAEYRAARLAQKMSFSCSCLPSKTSSRNTGVSDKHSVNDTRPQQNRLVNNTRRRIAVFQETNIKDVPRMYYRPWLGDKLPVADIDRKQATNLPFRV